MPDKKESCGAMWLKKSKAGNEYFSLQVDGESYVAFLNSYKQGAQPDYRIYRSEQRTLVPDRPRGPEPKDDEVPF